MYVTNPPARLIDEEDGHPIEQLTPHASRFGQIEIKKQNNALTIRAHDDSTNEILEFNGELTNQTLRGITITGGRRRDIDDDVLDALQLLGYTVIDPATQHY